MLSLSLFIAAVASLTRMYRDSEMTIWFASGIGLSRFVRPVLRMSWPVLLVVCCWRCSSGPGATSGNAELKERYEHRSDLSRVAPAQFQSSRDGRRCSSSTATPTTAHRAQRLRPDPQGDAESVTSARGGAYRGRGRRSLASCSSAASATSRHRQSGEKTLARFESYRALVGEKRRAPPPNCRRSPRTRTSSCCARPPGRHPGRTRLAHRPGAWRRQLAAAGRRTGRHQPAPARQLEPAARAARLRRLLQPDQPVAGLDRGRRVGMGSMLVAMHGGAFLLALALLWWRDHASTSRLFGPRHS